MKLARSAMDTFPIDIGIILEELARRGRALEASENAVAHAEDEHRRAVRAAMLIEEVTKLVQEGD